MPLTAKGSKIKTAMKKQYGAEKLEIIKSEIEIQYVKHANRSNS